MELDCPVSEHTSAPVQGFHTLIVVSALRLVSVCPSGLKTRLFTEPVCPVSVLSSENASGFTAGRGGAGACFGASTEDGVRSETGALTGLLPDVLVRLAAGLGTATT